MEKGKKVCFCKTDFFFLVKGWAFEVGCLHLEGLRAHGWSTGRLELLGPCEESFEAVVGVASIVTCTLWMFFEKFEYIADMLY